MVCIHTENQYQGDFYPFVLLPSGPVWRNIWTFCSKNDYGVSSSPRVSSSPPRWGWLNSSFMASPSSLRCVASAKLRRELGLLPEDSVASRGTWNRSRVHNADSETGEVCYLGQLPLLKPARQHTQRHTQRC